MYNIFSNLHVYLIKMRPEVVLFLSGWETIDVCQFKKGCVGRLASIKLGLAHPYNICASSISGQNKR